MRGIDEAPLSARERAAALEASRVLRARFPVQQVIVFGSKARGTGDAESDLDLLVLTRRPLGWRERRALVDALFDIELAHDVVFGPLIVARSDWQSGLYAVLPIHAEVARDGIAL